MAQRQIPDGWKCPKRPASFRALSRLEVRTAHLLVDHPDFGPLVASFPPRARRTIGRAPWCELVVDWDPAVSRAHAIIEAFGPVLTLEPAGATTNAVRVNGAVIEGRTPLADAQWVSVGTTMFYVRLPPDGELSDTVRVEPSAPAASPALTRAERRIVGTLAADATLTNREIAERLGLAHETVRTQVRAVLAKARGVVDEAQSVDRTTVVEQLRAAGLWVPDDEE